MLNLRPARAPDWPAVEALLARSALPIDGARDHLDAFLLAFDGDALVASAAIESYAAAGLLRSVAVAPGHRGHGVGAAVIALAIGQARQRGLHTLHLLTTTAAAYFGRHGFTPVARADAPTELQASAEFQGACPASAVLMRMDLRPVRPGPGAPARGAPPRIRTAEPDDAQAILAIYAPVVRDTAISFELEPPTLAQMRARIATASARLPWLVAVDAAGLLLGYAYASRHRERAAYQWSVDVSAYVHAQQRGRGVGKALYGRLFERLVAGGSCQAFAGIALPNAASVALHQSLGFAPIGVYRNVGFKLGAWRDVGWWQKELQRPDRPQGAPAG